MGTGSFPGIKRPGRGFDYPPPSSAEVKERAELYLYSLSGTSWPVIGWTLPLPLPLWQVPCITEGIISFRSHHPPRSTVPLTKSTNYARMAPAICCLSRIHQTDSDASEEVSSQLHYLSRKAHNPNPFTMMISRYTLILSRWLKSISSIILPLYLFIRNFKLKLIISIFTNKRT